MAKVNLKLTTSVGKCNNKKNAFLLFILHFFYSNLLQDKNLCLNILYVQYSTVLYLTPLHR